MSVVAAGFTEQAQVTNWPLRIALVVAMLAIVAVVLAAMLRGWRSRQRRQADIPAPGAWQDENWQDVKSVSGLYVGTATAGDWLDRIAVHGLGVRSRADIVVAPTGIGIRRVGASSFLIPRTDVVGVRTDRGVAGTVRAKDSVIVITWRLGGRLLDTGFRADDGTDHRTLLDGLMVTFPGINGDHTAQGAERTEGETS